MAKKRSEDEPTTISDQLRGFIRNSGISRNQLCKMTGLDPSHLHRFFHGTGALTNYTLDKLAAALGLKLVKVEDE
jgi:transcriptional regulator with XRE-family HTH domain